MAVEPVATYASGVRQTAAAAEPILSVRGVSKRFGATKALDSVDLDLRCGEIVGLVGDNAAGKSTLVKVIDGVLPPDSGEIALRGIPQDFPNALAARLAGIETVHQDLALCDNLTVYQNIFLGRELKLRVGRLTLLAKRRMRDGAARILAEQLGVSALPVERKANQLSGGQRQLVALARAEAWEADILLLDEPTAALSPEATGRVMEVMRRLRERGAALLVISHDLPQILEITDRIVVLRHGLSVASLRTGRVDAQLLLGLMTGMVTSAEVEEEA